MALRDGFGKGVVRAGEKNPNVMVICADLSESTRSLWFKEKFPERFLQIGVAEQNMAAVASGLAAVGKIPFIASYAMFSPGRNWEQIRTTICYNNQNVKIAGAHAGISVGPDGATHQAIEDVAITRPIANMTVIIPADAIEAEKATFAAAQIDGPVYIRYAREKTPVITTERTPFEIGRAEVYYDGTDVALVASGPLVYEALRAAYILKEKGISARVINNHTVKPIDEKTIAQAAQECGAIVTAEEHQVQGGMGSAVAEIVVKTHAVPMEFVGVQNRFGESGPPDLLMDKFGLRDSNIVEAAQKAIKRKKRPA
ncbi:MAG: transketolase [Candidatus Terrybacteria bacterium RIFCSPHIGHO2_01_FULL_48_17]|uniref:Transketolase n=1 Tax=Candidatus Terrybacteria bacterium RIFCSPHIGHO2_01_FULL_48_17 TaxID=1802362 RepID=A0A1G2PIM9_9BACT|nr:MAG: transketolase [Candidatus Terrybacteria bacterium RIFCSPHIGHO2_01_FULL_48_17]OHA53883.1 MAG: transketolase [Candidatus Terrybacteria bacterium RIFCSPLOWO2_01_FULL_48_14]